MEANFECHCIGDNSVSRKGSLSFDVEMISISKDFLGSFSGKVALWIWIS